MHHKIGFWLASKQHLRLRQQTAVWSPIWEKVPGSASAPLLRLQNCTLGVPAYNLRLQKNCSSGFMLIFFFFFFTMLFVFSCKSWNVAKPGARLVRPPPGAQQFQDLPPILSMVPWACAHSRHVVRAVSREVGNKVRGLPCFLFSEARTRLLPFNFPNTW